MSDENDTNSNKENTGHDAGAVRRVGDPTPIGLAKADSAIVSQIAEQVGEHENPQLRQQRASISEQAFVDRIRKSDRLMIGLTGVIAVGGLISAVIFGYQLHEMRTASYLTRESVQISEESLKISRDALNATQRPWVSIEMTVLGPLIFDPNGAEISIGVKLKNHGHSPALNVRDFIILDPDAAGRKGPDFCALQRTRTATNFAQIMFPDDTILETQIAHADSSEIQSAMRRRDTIAPLITACVDYISKLDDLRHQTELTVNLVRTPTTGDGVFAIKTSDGNVPSTDLHLENIFGSHKAD